MNARARDVGYLAVRIVAVFVLIIGLKHLPIFVSNLLIYLDPRYLGDLSRDPKVIAVLIIACLFPLLIFCLSYLLWFKADKLCGYFLRNKSKEGADSTKITAGTYLFFGSQGLVGFWRKLREYV